MEDLNDVGVTRCRWKSRVSAKKKTTAQIDYLLNEAAFITSPPEIGNTWLVSQTSSDLREPSGSTSGRSGGDSGGAGSGSIFRSAQKAADEDENNCSRIDRIQTQSSSSLPFDESFSVLLPIQHSRRHLSSALSRSSKPRVCSVPAQVPTYLHCISQPTQSTSRQWFQPTMPSKKQGQLDVLLRLIARKKKEQQLMLQSKTMCPPQQTIHAYPLQQLSRKSSRVIQGSPARRLIAKGPSIDINLSVVGQNPTNSVDIADLFSLANQNLDKTTYSNSQSSSNSSNKVPQVISGSRSLSFRTPIRPRSCQAASRQHQNTLSPRIFEQIPSLQAKDYNSQKLGISPLLFFMAQSQSPDRQQNSSFITNEVDQVSKKTLEQESGVSFNTKRSEVIVSMKTGSLVPSLRRLYSQTEEENSIQLTANFLKPFNEGGGEVPFSKQNSRVNLSKQLIELQQKNIVSQVSRNDSFRSPARIQNYGHRLTPRNVCPEKLPVELSPSSTLPGNKFTQINSILQTIRTQPFS